MIHWIWLQKKNTKKHDRNEKNITKNMTATKKTLQKT